MEVLEYIEVTTPSNVRKLLLEAHHFLLEHLPPFAKNGIKWKIPFYSVRRNLCYLNRHPDHITLGFPSGWKLAHVPGVLLGAGEKLKRVRYIEIFTSDYLYSDIVNQVLSEAIILDEMLEMHQRGKLSTEVGRVSSRRFQLERRDFHDGRGGSPVQPNRVTA